MIESRQFLSSSVLCNPHSCPFQNLSIALEYPSLQPLAASVLLPASVDWLVLDIACQWGYTHTHTHTLSVLGYFFVFVMQTRLAQTSCITKDVLVFLILLPPLPQCWGDRCNHLQTTF